MLGKNDEGFKAGCFMGNEDSRTARSIRTQKFLQIFPENRRDEWRRTSAYVESLQEIRLRAGKQILLYIDGEEYYLRKDGEPAKCRGQAVVEGICACREELEELLSYACSGSMYAYEEELGKGYLTLPGGHRMGLVGEVTLDGEERIRNIKHVAGINIRIAHERKGAADKILPYLYEGKRFLNTLILSPPLCGKTTLLRDLIRQVSNGSAWAQGKTVAVVDERSEIAGCYRGIAQNDVGLRTDVLDGCPKAVGMLLLLRSMAPGVIAVDELGGVEEIQAVRRALQCGCGILATMHAATAEEAAVRLSDGMPGRNSIFERYVVLEREEGERGFQIRACVRDSAFQSLDGGLIC